MKTIYASALVLFMSLSLAVNKISAQENKIIATFNSITENGFYKFIDDKKTVHLFYDISDDVEIALYDDSYLGKKFSITYSTKKIDELDDEGEETGEKITVKIILTIKEEN
ncbi:hypothetical protein [Polaribacter sargassicola]|uniref:hypothetical protein n=1 Tax=Polaribacter sargassicola TaxID=2836891 RepID=UPI001F360F82|nr:hypothetical protein [Polaribacter sp. DS7-9]MCG1035106.1 hypothetical protein [Polaribacter sp. DS7-9]